MDIVEKYKALVKIIEETKNLELKAHALDLQKDILDLKAEILKLRQENHRLQKTQEIEGQLQFLNNAYYRTINGKTDGPFCSKCWDAEKKLIYLHDLKGIFQCPECEKYGGPEEKTKDTGIRINRSEDPFPNF